jgi:hypothetical protein
VTRRAGSDLGRWIGVLLLVFLAAAFSFLNAGERVTLNVGFTMLYRISLVGLVFGAFLLGMIAMFLFGLHHDRRIRAALRASAYGATPGEDTDANEENVTQRSVPEPGRQAERADLLQPDRHSAVPPAIDRHGTEPVPPEAASMLRPSSKRVGEPMAPSKLPGNELPSSRIPDSMPTSAQGDDGHPPRTEGQDRQTATPERYDTETSREPPT